MEIKKVVIAIDSFKDSMSSLEAGYAVKKGIERVFDGIDICIKPLADGGEGTTEALTKGLGGSLQQVTVTGPLGEKVSCQYGIVKEQSLAIIEMASAAGIMLVPKQKRNPMFTTTYGVGEMILDAIQKGCENFLIGIGGSATNDGGIGMLQALGYGILNEEGEQVSFGGNGLLSIAQIKDSPRQDILSKCKFRVACDVTNPLCGSNGASAVFGPQKGATQEMINKLDDALLKYAQKTKLVFANADESKEGAGAAGGLGFAFQTFLNASLESGIQIVLSETGLEQEIQSSDLVITGEGRLDGQTVMGKAPIGVARLAKKYGKKVIAFSGCVAEDARICNEHGIDAYFPILRGVCTLEEALEKETAISNLTDTAEQVFRLIKSQ